MSDIDITIRTRSELLGAQETIAALERAIGKAKALGDVTELADLNEQLEKVRESIASADLAGIGLAKEMGVINVSSEAAAKILGKTGEGAEMSSGSFRKLARVMGSEVPGGAALMEAGFAAATEPMLGATFLLLGGIEMLKTAIAKINQEKEQARKISEALTDVDAEHSHAIDNQREALERAEIAERVFHHNFLRNTHDAIAQAERLAEAVLKTAVNIDEAEMSRRNTIAAQNIDGMEQHGVVSHAVALKMKEQLDIDYERQRALRMIAQDKLEEVALYRQLFSKQVALRNEESSVPTIESKYKSAAGAKAANDTKIEEAQRKISAGEETIKALRDTGVNEANIQKLVAAYEKDTGDKSGTTSLSEMFTYMSRSGTTWYVPRHDFGTSGDVNLATYEGAQIDIKSGKADLARAQKKRADLEVAEETAKSDVDYHRQSMQKNRDSVQDLVDKIAETKATNAIKERGVQSDLGQSRAVSALRDDRTTVDTFLSGGNVAPAAAEKMRADVSAIAGHQVDLNTAAQAIENGANNMGTFMSQVGRLSAAFSKFKPEEINKRISELEIQVSRIEVNSGF